MASRVKGNQEYRPPLGRIDARPQNDPATQAGLRDVHKDMRGNVIGAVTPEGMKLGTAKQTPIESGQGWRGGSATPRLDAGPQTPGLDSNPARPVVYTSAAELRAKDVAVARASALQGNFGTGAQKRAVNLQGRQALHSDMEKAGAGWADTPEFRARAQSLGVKTAEWRRGLGTATGMPSSVNPQSVVTKPTPAPFVYPKAPAVQRATDNMAKMGVQGAIADYRKRNPAAQAKAPATPPQGKPLAQTVSDLGVDSYSSYAAAAPKKWRTPRG